jgi:hypothetical protein
MLVRQLQSGARQQGPGAVGQLNQAATAPSERRSASGPQWDGQAKADFTSDQRLPSSRRTLDFSDLEQFDSAALAQVLHRCSSNTMLLALAGASHQFVQRILSQLPARQAAQLQRKIQQIGPLRLDDVQRAQQQLIQIAEQLVDEGTLTLPGKHRLSVAA